MDTPSSQVRERIIAEAGALFVRHGYDGISMREIAEACSLSKAGIYYHFKDKEDLFLALLANNLERVGSLLAEVQPEGSTTRERIELFARRLFTHLSGDERAVIRLANQEMSKLSAEIRETFGQRYFTVFIGPLQDIFAEGVKTGDLRPLDPKVSAWVLLGMLYPLFSASSETRPEMALKAVEQSLSIFFDGLSLK
jgi:AcrR family transcriptional regulator